MVTQIKNRINRTLSKFLQEIHRSYALRKISPLLFNCIKDFALREGKRIRPTLFIIGYLGFSKKPVANLYETAIAFELLHDFLLIHDDIIDKSDMRRKKPSMHKMLNNHLKRFKNIKFNGQDLSIIVGDVLHTLALNAFSSIKENRSRKEVALKKITESALFTECGEFIELLSGIKNIQDITKENIYKIYEYKTARYTFAYPLSIGATLAGAKQNQIDKLFKFGIYLGEAFQIKDDILGIFGEEKKIGKSILSDLKEAKKTILIWYAYHHSNQQNQKAIENILTKKNVSKKDLLKIQKIIISSGALGYAKKEVLSLMNRAEVISKSLQMKTEYEQTLSNYSKELFNLSL
jgi:geranylgeranyl diphosphate synthase type I